MSHRAIKAKDFVGKTIERMDCRAVNIIRFFFTDGTAIAIETDYLGAGLYGMVACDVCATYEPPKKRKRNDPSTADEGQGMNENT